jgi:hypothetical protein
MQERQGRAVRQIFFDELIGVGICPAWRLCQAEIIPRGQPAIWPHDDLENLGILLVRF